MFMPPRHGKSQLISEYFPAWYLGCHPSRRIILTTYGADFAREWGRKSRDVLTEWGPQLYGVSVRADSKAADSWNIAKRPGGMVTAGIGGDITGRGAHLLIIDDPVKNWEEAQSAVTRQANIDWYQSTAFTRLSPNGAVIVVCTRWHEMDLAGAVLDLAKQGGEQWETVSFPAIAEGEDELGRKPGQALWPESGWDEKALANTKAVVGPQKWISLYQQRPSPATGAIFKLPGFANRYKVLPKLDLKVMLVDTAFKEGVSNDYTAIAQWGRTSTNYYVISFFRQRVDFPKLIPLLVEQARVYRPHIILIEDKGSGISAIQLLRQRTRLPIIAFKAIGSKVSRAEIASPYFDANQVLLPEDAPWLFDWIAEHLAFPNGKHDDGVDTTSMALARLGTGEIQYVESVLDAAPSPDYDDSFNVWDEVNQWD